MDYKNYIKSKIETDSSSKDRMQFEAWLFELGLAVSQIREEKNLSQIQLAKKMGVTQSVISRIEGGHNMNCLTLWKLSTALKQNLNIFGASKNEEKNKVENFVFGKTSLNVVKVVNRNTKYNPQIVAWMTKPTSSYNFKNLTYTNTYAGQN